MYLTSKESIFAHFSSFFDKSIFGDLEKSAFIEKTKQILNILHEIPLIENKKLKNTCFKKYSSKCFVSEFQVF